MKDMIALRTALPIIDGLMTDGTTELIDRCELHDKKFILRDGDGGSATVTIEKTWENITVCSLGQKKLPYGGIEQCFYYDKGMCRRDECPNRKQEAFITDLKITLDWSNVGIFEYRNIQGASVRDGLQNIRKQVLDFVFK